MWFLLFHPFSQNFRLAGACFSLLQGYVQQGKYDLPIRLLIKPIWLKNLGLSYCNAVSGTLRTSVAVWDHAIYVTSSTLSHKTNILFKMQKYENRCASRVLPSFYLSNLIWIWIQSLATFVAGTLLAGQAPDAQQLKIGALSMESAAACLLAWAVPPSPLYANWP